MRLVRVSFQLKPPALPRERAGLAPAFPRDLVWQAVFSERGLRGLSISRRGADKGLHEIDGRGKLRARDAHAEPGGLTDARVKILIRRLQARLAGKRVDLDWGQFDLRGRPPFHVRIWKAMHAIPFGEARTYRQIARAAGSPHAFRAAGQACGANPILLFIPCHRVVSSSGLGGFGCGIEWKKRLLATEGLDWRKLSAR